jgi:hypothetical protein
VLSFSVITDDLTLSSKDENILCITCYLPSCGFYGSYTMDRNNYIEIHPTQAQVAKISYHHPSKYLNRIM